MGAASKPHLLTRLCALVQGWFAKGPFLVAPAKPGALSLEGASLTNLHKGAVCAGATWAGGGLVYISRGFSDAKRHALGCKGTHGCWKDEEKPSSWLERSGQNVNTRYPRVVE